MVIENVTITIRKVSIMLELNRNQKRTNDLRAVYDTSAISKEVYNWTNSHWRVINQRTVNGKYSKNPSIVSNPQVKSYHAKGVEVRMTALEFHTFVARNIQTYVDIVNKGGRPSIDRIDGDGHYEVSNLRIISNRDNIMKRFGKEGQTPKTYINKLEKTIRNRKSYITQQPQFSAMQIDLYIAIYSIKAIREALNDDEIISLMSPVSNDGINPNLAARIEAMQIELAEKTKEARNKTRNKVENSVKLTLVRREFK